MVTPLTVTPGWMRQYVNKILNGASGASAAEAASRIEGVKGKDYSRCHIMTGVLTVPVEGGSGVLKRRGAEPVISEHGKWRREHLGAWQAAYGRRPYYIHLMPEIERVYAGCEGKTLEEFNRELLEIALGWCDFAAIREDQERLQRHMIESPVKLQEGLTVFDALFRLGPDAAFGLYPWQKNE